MRKQSHTYRYSRQHVLETVKRLYDPKDASCCDGFIWVRNAQWPRGHWLTDQELDTVEDAMRRTTS